MPIFHVVLMIETFLCSLVAGFLFAFAVVVMPGIRHLDDGAFIRAFQSIDRVIQRNQPLFMLVWGGSVLAAVSAALLGLGALSGTDRLLAIAAALVYLLCVQLPTMAVNVPMNNALQKCDTSVMNDSAQKRARDGFERRWNQWNVFRTICGSVTTLLLTCLLVRL